MKIFVIFLIGFIFSVATPVFAQEMEFYHDELYEFSFEVPQNWEYQEEVSFNGKTIFQVLIYPGEFGLGELDESNSGIMDLASSLAGLDFKLNSPVIGILYENIPQTKVIKLNEIEIMEYALENIRVDNPHAKIIDSNIESHSWGWEVTVVSAFDLSMGFGKSMPYIAQNTTYFFNDRDAYSVFYMAHEDYYDTYRHAFDNVIDTMVIKGVVVPEFQEIALLVLASSIVMIVVFSRKFNFPILAINKK